LATPDGPRNCKVIPKKKYRVRNKKKGGMKGYLRGVHGAKKKVGARKEEHKLEAIISPREGGGVLTPGGGGCPTHEEMGYTPLGTP